MLRSVRCRPFHVTYGRQGNVGISPNIRGKGMNRTAVWVSLAVLSVSASAWANEAPQQQPFPPFEVDQVKVDKAIEQGIAYLKKGNASHMATFAHANSTMSHTELVLFTYV